MTSEAYVFIYLLGQATPVVAGRIRVHATGNDGFCEFNYGRSYLDNPNAIPLDPQLLPLEARVFRSEPGFEVFNVFRDAGPDHWGRRVIEKRVRRPALSELEYLLEGSDQRTGALLFRVSPDPIEGKPGRPPHAVSKLLLAAERVETGEPVADELLELLAMGSSSLGGMRPKSALTQNDIEWVAKFPSREDRYRLTRIEYATLRLARVAGIEVPEHRLIDVEDRDVLLARRFDRVETRVGIERRHMLSGLTMLGIHERDYGRGGYPELADWLRRFAAQPLVANHELFRRMLFNILVGNTDDHLRNHAVIYERDGYHLTPAYDLVPFPQRAVERYQAINVGRFGRLASIENALSHCERFGLSREQAKRIVEEIVNRIRGQWRLIFRESGIDGDELHGLEGAFLPENVFFPA